MMKRLIILLLIWGTFLPLIAGIGLAVYYAPHFLYYQIIHQGYSPSWFHAPQLKLESSSPFYTGLSIQKIPYDQQITQQKLWRLFHIRDFKLPLPYRHPLFTINPLVLLRDDGSQKVDLGLTFNNAKEEFLVEFKLRDEFSFARLLDTQKLFLTPLASGILGQIPDQKIWQDLFTLNLPLTYQEIKKSSPEDLLYALYIRELRLHYFPRHLKKLTFMTKKNVGIAEFDHISGLALGPVEDVESEITPLIPESDHNRSLKKQERHRLKYEVIFMLDSGSVHSYQLISNSDSDLAFELRARLLMSTFYYPSYKESAATVYNNFLRLPRDEQIEQEGMFYLFSAWTHQLEDKDFLQNIIKYLERGRGNLGKLQFLYNYALKKYGSNFSNDERKRLESAEERIKREAAKEDEELLRAIEGKGNEGSYLIEEGTVFKNENERAKSYLQESKKRKKKERPQQLRFQ